MGWGGEGGLWGGAKQQQQHIESLNSRGDKDKRREGETEREGNSARA